MGIFRLNRILEITTSMNICESSRIVRRPKRYFPNVDKKSATSIPNTGKADTIYQNGTISSRAVVPRITGIGPLIYSHRPPINVTPIITDNLK